MPAREHPVLLQLRELLARGPGAPRRRSRLLELPLRWLRKLLLKALRPYSYYQAEVNNLLLQYLAHSERSHRGQAQQLERLEEVVSELIAACEALRRHSDLPSGQAADQAVRALEEAREVRRIVVTLRDELNSEPRAAASSWPANP